MCKRVLIVDDRRHIRTLLHSVLEPLSEENVQVASVDSVDEALAAVVRQRPDLVFASAELKSVAGQTEEGTAQGWATSRRFAS